MSGMDTWSQGDAYERFMGRWSRRVAPLFLDWLGPRPGLRWADVGCGTGALSREILSRASPSSLLGLDPSAGFVATAAGGVQDPRATFSVGDAGSLPRGSLDVVVSGLVLNFVPDPDLALAQMAAAAPGGVVAAYVWDYADGMELLRHFWDAVTAVDPAAAGLDEGQRFPLARPEALRAAWERAGLGDLEQDALVVDTVFHDFDDYWTPFLGGQGPAAGYVASRDPATRERLRRTLEEELRPGRDGRIRLSARAWAIRGSA
jgi:SAM-dependent methyltransferase